MQFDNLVHYTIFFIPRFLTLILAIMGSTADQPATEAIANVAAPGISYFTPEPWPVAGSGLDEAAPKLFTP